MDLIVTNKAELQQLIQEAVGTALQQYKPKQSAPEKFLSVTEAAKRLRVAPLTIYRGVKKGNIPHKRIGAKIKILSSYCEK